MVRYNQCLLHTVIDQSTTSLLIVNNMYSLMFFGNKKGAYGAFFTLT